MVLHVVVRQERDGLVKDSTPRSVTSPLDVVANPLRGAGVGRPHAAYRAGVIPCACVDMVLPSGTRLQAS